MNESKEPNFIAILIEDVEAAVQRRETRDIQSTRRDLVRTSFAAIEGFIWMFREHILEIASQTYGLEPEEEAVLAETSLHVSEQGKIHAQKKYIPLLSLVRLIARIAKRIAPTAQIDFSDQGWAQIQGALKIRNRITHPKNSGDLFLDDTDMTTILNAFFWLFEQVTAMLEHSNKAQKNYHSRVSELLTDLKSGDDEAVELYNRIRLAQTD